MRLCLGHPKVHFGTIVEGSWREGGAQGVLRAPCLKESDTGRERQMPRDKYDGVPAPKGENKHLVVEKKVNYKDTRVFW